MPKPVTSKKDFVRRYQRGEFGNRSPTWETVLGWMNDPNGHGTRGWNGPKLYHLRNRVAGGDTYYNLTANQLIARIPNIQGSIDNYYVSEMAPTDRTLIQGEVQRQVSGLYLRYSTVKAPMREALGSSQEHTWGLQSKIILQNYLCPSSYYWLEYLLDTYKSHVIEFSTYSVNWGTVPGVNTVWWEVRKY